MSDKGVARRHPGIDISTQFLYERIKGFADKKILYFKGVLENYWEMNRGK
jgi:hypothetical protein